MEAPAILITGETGTGKGWWPERSRRAVLLKSGAVIEAGDLALGPLPAAADQNSAILQEGALIIDLSGASCWKSSSGPL